MAQRLVSVDENYMFPTPLEARLDGKIGAARWVRPALGLGTDLNTLTTPGLHPVNTGGIASSLLNAPPGFSNPGSVEVMPASSTNGIWQQTVRMYWSKDVTRTFSRHSLSNAFSGPWESTKPTMGSVPNGTDWNTVITPGQYSLDNFTASATMTNLPPTPGGFAGSVEVLPITATRVTQRATEYASGTPGTTWVRTQAINGTFGAWGRTGWDSVALANAQDLGSLLTPGRYRANTGAIATTILDRPAGVTQPFTVNVALISSTNGVYLQELVEWSSAGPKSFSRLSLSSKYSEWDKAGAKEVVASRTQVTALGDSLTEGGDISGAWPAGSSWPEKLSAILPGVTVVNRGHSGDSSDEILLRTGIITARFTVADGALPATGPVNLTTSQILSIRDGRAMAGTLAGVYGNLRHVSGKDWMFTRAANGTAVPAPGKQAFTSSAAASNTDTLTYWAGRNDISMPGEIMEPTQAEHLVANAVKVMEWAAPRQKQVLIIGPTTGTHERAGSSGFLMIAEANRRLRELFPANYVSAQDYMVTRALSDMGVTPTPADAAAVSAGEMPPSLIAPGDTIHFSQAAAANFAQNFVAPNLLGRGWV